MWSEHQTEPTDRGMSAASRNHRCLVDFTARGALKIQSGFPCGNWNDKGVGVLQLRPFNVTDGGQIDLSSAKFIETDKKLDSYLLRDGDVIFNNTNSEALVGKTAYWARSENAVLSNHMTILRVIDQEALSGQFLAFYLLLKWYDGHFNSICQRHVNQASVGKDRLGATVLPPIEFPEQKKIAHILSTVQRAIEAQERIIQTTTELKKALMHKLFTEGLRNEPQKQTEIGPVPESWEVVELGSLAKVGNGSTPKRANEAYWEGGTIPWLNSTKIHDRFITESDQFVTPQAVKECHLPRVAPNSLLIAITGQGKTLGNSAITRIETCINQHLAYAQFHAAKIVPDFVLWFMQTRYDYLRSIAHGGGSTKGALTCGFLKTLPIPVPSRAEQEKIATTFQTLEDKRDFAVRKQAALQDLFRTLLHELMTAKTRVHEVEVSA